VAASLVVVVLVMVRSPLSPEPIFARSFPCPPEHYRRSSLMRLDSHKILFMQSNQKIHLIIPSSISFLLRFAKAKAYRLHKPTRAHSHTADGRSLV
jgi:hypothetical protein